MSNATDVGALNPVPTRLQPWLIVPLLYFMEAVPVTIVQEVATVFYKDLGVPNESIVFWTSLLAVPWSLQLLLGPLVDLNATKRRWMFGTQAVIAVGLILVALLLRAPHFFELTLLILGATAVTSALCNIATDGYYILSLSRDDQAKFIGVQTTCYRLGRLFCIGLLVLLVGLLMKFPPLHVEAPKGQPIAISNGGKFGAVQSADLVVSDGLIKTSDGAKLVPEMKAPVGVYGLSVDAQGGVTASGASGSRQIGSLAGTGRNSGGGPFVAARPVQGMSPALAWTLIIFSCGVIYALSALIARARVQQVPNDAPAAPSEPGETSKNILRSLVLLTMCVSAFFAIKAVTRLAAHGIWLALDSSPSGNLKGWMLGGQAKIVGIDLGFGALGTEVFQLVLCLVIALAAFFAARRLLFGTPMAHAFSTFVGQPGFPAIFGFIMFYRFSEAMVVKMAPLFLKDSLDKGGLAIPNDQLGLINGVAGVLGIVCGGIAGGYVVSKLGLRRSFWPLAVAMHSPNLLYLWASFAHPSTAALYGIAFVDQFGYGFGFAAYIVYLMWVAQRGSYKTSHYAVGTGMGALWIATAGAVSGPLQANFGYSGFFLAVVLFGIPGLLSLLFIPIDDSHRIALTNVGH